MKRAVLVAGTIAVAVAVAAKVLEKEAGVENWALVEPEIKEPFHEEDLLFENGTGLVLGYRRPKEAGLSVTERMTRWEAIVLRLVPGVPEWRQVYSGHGTMLRASSVGGGVVYALTEKLDVDLGVKGGLNSAEPDLTAMAGMAWRF